ncbi:hypothetical protein, partial [Staphylococcus cohnii]|uniref:hypothetical protein n=1 Tax=Staphylococcus cohnii TaxID=29382 RepID=UPI001E4B697A
FPGRQHDCKIVWNIYQDTKAKAHLKQFIPSNILMKCLFYKINNMNQPEIISNKELELLI